MPAPESTAVLLVLNLALTLAAVAIGAAWRRRARVDRDATARRIEALTDRVARLELRAPAAEPRPVPTAVPKSTRRADPARPEPSAGPTLIAVPNLAAPAAEPPASATADLGRRFGAIWELADAGVAPEAIARATGQPIGQVELILGLKRQLAGSGASPERSRLP